MKTSKLFARGVCFVFSLATLGFFLSSCEPSNSVTPELTEEEKLDNEAALSSEIEESFYYDDIDELTASAVEADMSGSGKIQSDDRLLGAVVTRSGDAVNGTLTIDFGAGATDIRGLIRRGTIVVTYNGPQDKPGSTREVTFVNLRVGDVKVEGTRRVKLVSVSEDVTIEEIDVENGIITWPDGTVARRKLHRIRECHRGNILDRLIIYGTEQGNHRNGRGFYIEILERLVFDRECMKNGGLIAIEGKKLIKHGYREITVDYGDGRCENKVSITNKNGRTWEYEVGTGI